MEILPPPERVTAPRSAKGPSPVHVCNGVGVDGKRENQSVRGEAQRCGQIQTRTFPRAKPCTSAL